MLKEGQDRGRRSLIMSAVAPNADPTMDAQLPQQRSTPSAKCSGALGHLKSKHVTLEECVDARPHRRLIVLPLSFRSVDSSN
jgi:hypothetical protein